ncbi:hypothetical protein JCM10212_005005, partial [Sporobolomyces blumeae]
MSTRTSPPPPPPPSSSADPFESLRNLTTARKRYVCAWLAIFLFDWLATLPSETKYIWRAKWTWLKAFFLINRYWALVFLNLTAPMIVGSVSWDVCRRVAWFQPVGGMIIIAACSVILSIRTAAIYDGKVWVRIVLGALLLSGGTVLVLWASQLRPFQLPPFVARATGFEGCISQPSNSVVHVAAAVWIVPLVFDTAILGLTMYRVVRLRKRAGALPLLGKIAETGLWYTVVITASNLVNVVLYA